MYIRRGTPADAGICAEVEAICFPPAEAAPLSQFIERMERYSNHFWLLFESEKEEKLIGFVDGFCTDERDLTDEMYADASLHDEGGDWQMIFGVNTLPEYRRQGLAGQVIERVIADARAEGRKGLVLTCKDFRIHYYAKFGFVEEFLSDSDHGGAVWYQMRLTF